MSLSRIVRRAAGALHARLVRASFRLFEAILPVRRRSWCFCTWEDYPHTLDNPRAVFEEVKADPSLRKVVLQKDASEPPVREGANVVFVPAESFRGAYHLARSRVVILGYALFGLSSYADHLDAARHTVIQLWHGIPLKRIGRLFPWEEFWEDETGRYAATVCSSEPDRDVMARAFAPIPRERVWQTGLPRNAFLLGAEDGLPADYREHLRRLEERLGGRRLVLYAPTWRERTESLYSFSREQAAALEQLFARHDAVLGVRGHPNVRGDAVFASRSDAGRIVSMDDLPDPNVLLRRTDVLVTDYSSIYIDFLLLDRPILHFAYDLEDYRAERGFLYEPEEAFAGPTALTFDDLVDQLDVALAEPGAFADRREQALRLFHDHPEDSAVEVTRRITRLVGADRGSEASDATDFEEVPTTVAER